MGGALKMRPVTLHSDASGRGGTVRPLQSAGAGSAMKLGNRIFSCARTSIAFNVALGVVACGGTDASFLFGPSSGAITDAGSGATTGPGTGSGSGSGSGGSSGSGSGPSSGSSSGAPTGSSSSGGGSGGSGSSSGSTTGSSSGAGSGSSSGGMAGDASAGTDGGAQGINTVFLILEDYADWSELKGSPSAPYLNGTLLPQGAHCENYQSLPNLHSSLANGLWLEAGSNFGVTADANPFAAHQSTTQHLVTQLKTANIAWKAYAEGIDGNSCPSADAPSSHFAISHVPFAYFDDVTNDPAYCTAHIRPFTELASDLAAGTVARYNFIVPNSCDDGSGSCNPQNDFAAQIDAFLSVQVPVIQASAAYVNNGAIFVTWDENDTGNNPIGLIVLSPLAKPGFASSTHFDHSSTLRTMQRIFGVSPYLGGAASATDLGELFTKFP
jgi:hypothetical protein